MSYPVTLSPHRSSRKGAAINAIILHFTAGASLSSAVQWFLNPKSQVSAHYVIDRDGSVVRMVPVEEKAWHAGASSLFGDPRVNTISIGIEMVNWGDLRKRDGKFYCWPGEFTREYDVNKYGTPILANNLWWAPYTEEQFQACASLCKELVAQFPEITRERIVGHEDVAPGRKLDPGPAFDWERFRSEVFSSPSPMYIDSDEIPEEELITSQAEPVEPEPKPEPQSWVSRLRASWRSRFSKK